MQSRTSLVASASQQEVAAKHQLHSVLKRSADPPPLPPCLV